MKNKALCLILAGIMGITLTACGGGTEDVSSSDTKTVDGKTLDKEQYYNTYLSADPSTLDPVKGNDTEGGYIIFATTEPLTRMDEQDGTLKRVAAGAESWESNEDGSVWTFKLRENKWSDGVDVTVDDYIYGIQRTLDPNCGSLNSYLITCIKNGAAINKGEMDVSELGVKALDDKTLEITLEQPTPYFLSLTDTRAMMPARKDIIEKNGEVYGAEADKVIGNGPFKVETWLHNSEVTLTKNENYWNTDQVYLEKLTYKIISDDTTLYNSFDSGDLDVVNCGKPEWIDRFDGKEDAIRTDVQNPSIRFHFFNTQDELFKNENIRKAFSAAIDREDVSKSIYFDTMTPYYGWVPSGVDSGDGKEYGEIQKDPLKEILTENPKDLLLKGMEELGLGDDPSQITVKFTVGGTNQWLRTYGEYFQQKYKEVLGVNIELDQNEWGTFQSKTIAGEYQMAYMVWTLDYNDPIAMLEILKSNAGAIPTFWSNEEFDELINQASNEMDVNKRIELYKQAEKIFLESSPIAPVVQESRINFRYDYTNGVGLSLFNTMGMQKIYISGR